MPRAEIADAYGISIKLEAGEVSYTELGEKALDLYQRAVAATDRRPTGPASGVQAERRGEHSLGFGRRLSQAPVPYQHHDGGD